MGQLKWTNLGRFFYEKPAHHAHYLRAQRKQMRSLVRAEPSLDSACVRAARLLMGMAADGVSIALQGEDGVLRTRAAMHRDPAQDAYARTVLDGGPVHPSRPNGRAFYENQTYWPEGGLRADDPNAVVRGFVHRFGGVASLVAVPLRDSDGAAIGGLCMVRMLGGDAFEAEDVAYFSEVARDLSGEIASWQPNHSGIWLVAPAHPALAVAETSADVLAEVLTERRRSEAIWVRTIALRLADADQCDGYTPDRAEWRRRLNEIEQEVVRVVKTLPAQERGAVPIGSRKKHVVATGRGMVVVWPPGLVSDQSIADMIHDAHRAGEDAGEEIVILLVVGPDTRMMQAQFRRLERELSAVATSVHLWDQRAADERSANPAIDSLLLSRTFVGLTGDALLSSAPEADYPDLYELIKATPLWARR